MQVEHLFILVFTDDPKDEAALSGRALFDKNRQTNPSSKVLLHIDTRTPSVNHAKGIGRNAQKLARKGELIGAFMNGQFDAGTTLIDGRVANYSESDNIGVYLVFHCSRNGVPVVFDSAVDLRGETPLFKLEGRVAEQMVRIVQGLGLDRIRKLCLVACTTTKAAQNAEHGFLSYLCEAMQRHFQAPPMIAGWDDYLTVRADGRKLVGSTPEEKLASENRGMKRIAEFKGGRYVFSRIEASGWSDRNQLPSNTGTMTSSF